MRTALMVGALLFGLPALVFGWAYVHREQFYRQDFAAAYLRHLQAAKSNYRIDPASVRVHPFPPYDYVACGSSRVGAPATFAIQFSATLFGQKETEYAKWSNRWQAAFLTIFCDGKRTVAADHTSA